jgi:nucleotide-binding universal stress UspA family protein
VIKNILVPLSGLPSDGRSIDAAVIVAAKFSAEVECLRVHPSPMQIIARAAVQQFATTTSTSDLIASLEDAAAKQTRDARATYEQLARRQEGVKLSWRQIGGDCVPSAIKEARYHDLTVCARTPAGSDLSLDALASIVVGCGRPVLLVPDHPIQAIGVTVAIAWKETAEAAHAVTASMPLIAGANRVLALTVVEGDATDTQCSETVERLAGKLRAHDLKTSGLSILPAGRPPWRVLSQTARELGADLIVMGAYGHSRVRELIFGGFTRDALRDCDLPVLFMH